MNNNTYSSRQKQEPSNWNDIIERATGWAFDWHCPFCGADLLLIGYVRAHISPVGTGVGFVPGNIVLACSDCNVSMSDTHAWQWCVKQGISYWWMLPILETIQKIFQDNEVFSLAPKITLSIRKRIIDGTKPNDKSILALQWLNDNPDDMNLTGRELEANRFPSGVKISYRTWNDAKKRKE